jgi:uncharacterized protein with FMN-binding domain
LARLEARSAARRRELAGTGAAGATPPPPTSTDPTDAPDLAVRPPRRRRRHAARGSRTAALFLSVGSTIGLAGYFRSLSTAGAASPGSAGALPATTPTAGSATTTGSERAATTSSSPSRATGGSAVTTTPTTTEGSNTTSGGSASATLADGTYTGATKTNRWGPVQVQITVTGGRITTVDVLQVPSSKPKDVAINNRAVPVLVQETLAAQSAAVHSVSGATYTSTSYAQSLQTAIDAAGAAA